MEQYTYTRAAAFRLAKVFTEFSTAHCIIITVAVPILIIVRARLGRRVNLKRKTKVAGKMQNTRKLIISLVTHASIINNIVCDGTRLRFSETVFEFDGL